jgi:hypothetical protein
VATAVLFYETRVVASIGDPDGTRTVTSIIALLVALGLALAMIAIWMYRTTRPDPEVLAPLEVMGDRKWRRSDPVAQRRQLDQYRPAGAKPLTPSAAPPNLDEAYDAGPTAQGFDDLHDPSSDDKAVDDQRPDHRNRAASPSGPPTGGEPTPLQTERPDSFNDDIDPELLAAAAAELEAELHHESDAG